MACESWKERLVADLYGELAAEGEREALSAHLAACAGCRQAREELVAARAALRWAELPVPAAPRLVLFPLARTRRAALPFAAGFAAAALLSTGLLAGWLLRAPTAGSAAATGVSVAEVDARLAAQRQAFEQALAAQERMLRSQIANTPVRAVTHQQVVDLLTAAERRVDQRRATDVRYLMGEIGAAEMRAGASIGETQRALQYVALANNPAANLR